MSGRLLRLRTAAALAAFIGPTLLFLLAACGAIQDGTGNQALSPPPWSRDGDTQISWLNGKPGIGGTGTPALQPGIGGTGEPSKTPPGIGGTGIIGTITGFGSIFVNGYEVEYQADLPISLKGQTVTPDALRVGQVVAIEATGEGERLTARNISVRHEVAGPIEWVDRDAGRAGVLGQTVEIPNEVIVDDASRTISIDDLKVGDRIDVSGLRRGDGVIAASRVDKVRQDSPALIRGTVSAVDDKGFVVNGVRVESPVNARAFKVAVNQPVEVIGVPVSGRLGARKIHSVSARPFGGRIKRLSVEGYARQPRGAGLTIGRLRLNRLQTGSQIKTGDHVIVDGALDRQGRLSPATVRRPKAIRRLRNGPSRTRQNLSPRRPRSPKRFERRDRQPGIFRSPQRPPIRRHPMQRPRRR